MTKPADKVALDAAKRGSRAAAARLAGMKIRAQIDPPRAAVGTFPYPHRTCAEWKELPSGKIVEREMTTADRRKDAIRGSAKLRDAILALAA